MPLGAKEEQEEVKLEMTPMIDVTFLLLIFFMCATKFKEVEGKLDSYLPKNKGVASKPKEQKENLLDLKIEIENENGKPKIYVNDWYCSDFNALTQKLKELQQISENVPVTIAPRADVPFEMVINTLNACAKAGFIENVSFAQPESVIEENK